MRGIPLRVAQGSSGDPSARIGAPRSGISMKKLSATLVLVPVFLLLAGCGSSKDASTTTATACTPDKLPTHAKGVLTVATDKPAYPPYFENDDPTNGKGFESAVAYAIAGRLGIDRSKVKWAT